MTHLDTCVLIDALTGPRRSAAALRALIERGERLGCSTLVLYEWARGPRHPDELRVQASLLPAEAAAVFGPVEARLAADLYARVRHPRGREIDLAIAACALSHDAELWTLHRADFADIPGLRLAGATGR
jgi:predicted nucleic acid-binding protein